MLGKRCLYLMLRRVTYPRTRTEYVHDVHRILLARARSLITRRLVTSTRGFNGCSTYFLTVHTQRQRRILPARSSVSSYARRFFVSAPPGILRRVCFSCTQRPVSSCTVSLCLCFLSKFDIGAVDRHRGVDASCRSTVSGSR